jgi:hypothetical protein
MFKQLRLTKNSIYIAKMLEKYVKNGKKKAKKPKKIWVCSIFFAQHFGQAQKLIQ